jgi:acyl carrier protein
MGHQDLTTQQVMSVLLELVRQVSDTKRPIGPATSFIADLEIDSLTMVRLDTLIQARLGLALSAEHLDRVETVEDLARVLLAEGQPVSEL